MENQKIAVIQGERVMTSKSGDVLHFYLESTVFFSFYCAEKKDGCAFQLGRGSLTAETLGVKLAEVERYLGKVAAKLEVKVVGGKALAHKARDLLASLKVTPATVAEKDMDRLEVFFYLHQGRVRVGAMQGAALVAPAAHGKVKVMIVDDSSTVRKLLLKILTSDPDVEVVADVENPLMVETLIRQHKPDVITLDIHMPEMDGVTLLKSVIVPKFGIPTVMITAISKDEGPVVFEALEAGAVDYIQKPSMEMVKAVAPTIVEKIKTASRAKLAHKAYQGEVTGKVTGTRIDQNLVVAIGSSTGGTEALKEVLTRLPANIPPILIVQHIPAVFSLAFANRLNSLCPFEVKEAADGDEVRPGRVLIAPGGLQMRLTKSGGKMKVVVEDSAPVNRHKPSVDVLFDSVAEYVKKDAVGVILTGMGADGARGMLKMKQAGARTIAQDEATCVVFGMPREAIKIGGAEQVVPLLKIPQAMVDLLEGKKKAA